MCVCIIGLDWNLPGPGVVVKNHLDAAHHKSIKRPASLLAVSCTRVGCRVVSEQVLDLGKQSTCTVTHILGVR